jgi:hypothetical protein
MPDDVDYLWKKRRHDRRPVFLCPSCERVVRLGRIPADRLLTCPVGHQWQAHRDATPPPAAESPLTAVGLLATGFLVLLLGMALTSGVVAVLGGPLMLGGLVAAGSARKRAGEPPHDHWCGDRYGCWVLGRRTVDQWMTSRPRKESELQVSRQTRRTRVLRRQRPVGPTTTTQTSRAPHVLVTVRTVAVYEVCKVDGRVHRREEEKEL